MNAAETLHKVRLSAVRRLWSKYS